MEDAVNGNADGGSGQSRGLTAQGWAVVIGIIGLFLAFTVLFKSCGASHGGSLSQHEALRKIESLGGAVPKEWWSGERWSNEPQPVYRLRLLDITLGPEWEGGNEGMAHFRSVQDTYELILDSPEINDRGLAELNGIRLGGLTVKNTRVTHVGLRRLQDVRGMQLLRLVGNHTTDAELEAVQNHNLMWLMVDGDCRVTDVGLEYLRHMNRMIRLELPGAGITGTGLVHVGRLTELRSLVLKDTQIDDESLRHLSGLKQLQRLDLSGTRVAGPGLVHLKSLDQLEELYLDNTAVSDDTLRHVASLDQLVFVSFTGTAVTPTGLKALDAMPHLQTARIDKMEQ